MTNNFNDFTFSFSLAEKAKNELEDSHQKIQERINNITDSEKFFVGGFPVLKNIIYLQPSKQDLKKLAKAIERLSELVEVFEELDNKLNVIKTVQTDPEWFAWACGDFTNDVDKAIEQMFNSKD